MSCVLNKTTTVKPTTMKPNACFDISKLTDDQKQEYNFVKEKLYLFVLEPNMGNIERPFFYKLKSGMWTSHNQLSSFELITKISNYLFKKSRYNYDRNRVQLMVNLIIETDQEKYGIYKTTDDWAVIFTDNQLNNFITLCLETYFNYKYNSPIEINDYSF